MTKSQFASINLNIFKNDFTENMSNPGCLAASWRKQVKFKQTENVLLIENSTSSTQKHL